MVTPRPSIYSPARIKEIYDRGESHLPIEESASTAPLPDTSHVSIPAGKECEPTIVEINHIK